MARQGRYEEGLAQELQAVQIQRAIGFNVGRPQQLCQLVDAYIAAGRFDDAVGTLAEALPAVEAQGERYYEPEIHRLRGELLLKMGPSDVVQAESCFENAIKVARQQDGKSLELRATTSLARLLAWQDRRGEALAMLSEIYNWFTEGFDTADLKDAKALLEELAT